MTRAGADCTPGNAAHRHSCSFVCNRGCPVPKACGKAPSRWARRSEDSSRSHREAARHSLEDDM